MRNSFNAKTQNNFDGFELFDSLDFGTIPDDIKKSFIRWFLAGGSVVDGNHGVATDKKLEERQNLLNSVNRQHELIKSYCGQEVHPLAYRAAALGALISNNMTPGSENDLRAKYLVHSYMEKNSKDNGLIPGGIDSQEAAYFASLLYDQNKLTGYSLVANSKYQNDDISNKDTWLEHPKIISAEDLYSVTSEVNIESIVIAGASVIEKLNNDIDDEQALQLIRYSDYILAPVIEVIGFDTMALALNSLTKSFRLKKAGREDLVDKASSMLGAFDDDRYSNKGEAVIGHTNELVENLLNLPSGSIDLTLPVQFDDQNNAISGYSDNSKIELSDGSNIGIDLRFRLKSVGSLADKMRKIEDKGNNGNKLPVDALGLTVVASNKEDQIKLFYDLVTDIVKNPDIDLVSAPGKTSAVHIRGDSDFIVAMSQGISDLWSIDEMNSDDENTATNSLSLGKVTGMFRGKPFEVQVVTREMRDAMQIGSLAHILYKCHPDGMIDEGESSRWSHLLQSIKKRRSNLAVPCIVGSAYGDNLELINEGRPEKNARNYLEQIKHSREEIEDLVGWLAAISTT